MGVKTKAWLLDVGYVVCVALGLLFLAATVVLAEALGLLGAVGLLAAFVGALGIAWGLQARRRDITCADDSKGVRL